MDIFIGTTTSLGIGWACYSYMRNHLKRKVNCWFCNQNSYVEWKKINEFVCEHCEQFNGFNKSGDYTRPMQHYTNSNKRYCVSSSNEPDLLPNDNGLCGLCNTKQAIIIEKLAQFEATNEEKFNEEYDHYKYKLDQTYPLCSDCSLKTHQKLQQEKVIHRHLLDLKYKLFPVIKNTFDKAAKLTSNLVKRKRRHFFDGGAITEIGHISTFVTTLFIFAVHFNFLQEDTNVIFVSMPSVIERLLSFATNWTYHIAFISLLSHLLSIGTNQSRINLPDLLLPLLLALHIGSYSFWEKEPEEDSALFRCGISALFSVMSFIVLIVPRKKLHKTKPNPVISSAFSVASTPLSQCSSQNISILNSSLIERSSPRSQSNEFTSPRLTKQLVKERLQWREREKTPEMPSPRPKKFLFQQLIKNSNIKGDMSYPEDMDWEPTPPPSVVSLSQFSSYQRRDRENTPSRVLSSSLSGLSLGSAKSQQDRLFFASATRAPSLASGFTSISRMRPLVTKNESPKANSVFTSVSQKSEANEPGHRILFVAIISFLAISVIANMVFLYCMFYRSR